MEEIKDLNLESEKMNSDPEVPTNQGDVLIDQKEQHESLSLKLPSGFELVLSSLKFDVYELTNFALQLHDILMNSAKKSKMDYVQ